MVDWMVVWLGLRKVAKMVVPLAMKWVGWLGEKKVAW